MDQPELFESLGFTGGSEACLGIDFVLDRAAEVMGTQVSELFCKGSLGHKKHPLGYLSIPTPGCRWVLLGRVLL